ncbi:phage tail tape measure protein [Pannonibacter tanglangensis]|uniref:Phage tail tape measure protein n=1 Tax=Pannonibacter tanglangensis TaxID=2750084 RepID=A0ABW9ZHC6_9HYPH|nr:phage tail tape measure protein [Pannonibacter sp. XCT-34]NBN63826.1 phage tail tape measure protein [Pannonibacter sp. XCT-34]
MAVTRTARLRLQLIDSVSANAKGVAAALKGVDATMAKLGKSSAPGMRKFTKELEHLQRKSTAIDDFTRHRIGLKELAIEMKLAKRNVADIGKQFSAVKVPTKEMAAQMAAARENLRRATQAFREQGVAARASEAALRQYGINGQRSVSAAQSQIRTQIAQTIRKMRELDREARKPKPKPAPTPREPAPPRPVRHVPTGPYYDPTGVAAGGIAAFYGQDLAKKAFAMSLDFDRAVQFQKAIGDLSDEQSTTLQAHAIKLANENRFSNVDVVAAQTSMMQAGIRDIVTVMGMMRPVTDYALAMGITLEEAAETVKGASQSKRVNIKDPKAVAGFVDYLVQMAKQGGMSDEDVRQYIKYGGASTTGIGLTDAYAAAMGVVLRRSGVRGDEAGVFARSASAKLVAPTNKGRTALAAMGIDYNKFVKMPDAMNIDGINEVLKLRLGKSMTPEMRQQVQTLLDEGEFYNSDGELVPVASDAGEFTTQIGAILAPLFEENGKLAAKDAEALSKALSDYHKYSAESVDVIGLFNEIFSRNPSIPQLNAFFTDKQGGRAQNIGARWAEFMDVLKLMENIPADLANKIGRIANEGSYGDWTRMTGTIETAMTNVARDWENVTRPLIRATDSLVDSFNQLDPAVRQVVSGLLFAAAAFGGIMAARSGISILGRLLGMGGGAAATGAAGGAAAGAAATAAAAAGRTGLVAKAGRMIRHPATLGAAAVYWALSNQSDGAKDKDLVKKSHEVANRFHTQRILQGAFAGKDVTLGSTGRLNTSGQAAPGGKFLNAPTAFRRSDAGISVLPVATSGGLAGSAPADSSLLSPKSSESQGLIVNMTVNAPITFNGVGTDEVKALAAQAAQQQVAQVTAGLNAAVHRLRNTRAEGTGLTE